MTSGMSTPSYKVEEWVRLEGKGWCAVVIYQGEDIDTYELKSKMANKPVFLDGVEYTPKALETFATLRYGPGTEMAFHVGERVSG